MCCSLSGNSRGTSYMDSMQTSDSSHHGIVENSPYRTPCDNRYAEGGQLGASWYFSRKEIEENSLSRRDGIDLKKESYLRKSYCTFLQDLGMRLKVWEYAASVIIMVIILVTGVFRSNIWYLASFLKVRLEENMLFSFTSVSFYAAYILPMLVNDVRIALWIEPCC